jgi:SEC-C motif
MTARSQVKLGRNDPCWCGSGAKFKRCHLERQGETLITHDDIMRRIRASRIGKSCLHPAASASTCSRRLVRSHSISKSALSAIAEDGHVFEFHGDYDVFLRLHGDVEPRPVGIRSASTFPAFCVNHDCSTFSPIEQGRYRPCEEHAILASYRAVCRELFWAEAGTKLSILDDLDRLLPSEAQGPFRRLAEAKAEDTERTLAGIRLIKAAYDAALLAQDYSQVKFYAIAFASPPDVMMTSLFAPFVDFRGKVIREGDIRGTTDDHMILSLFASGSVGWFQLAWLGESRAGLEFTRSLAAFTDEEMPHAIIRLVFSGFENIFFRPGWWAGLSDSDRVYLHRRFWRPRNPFQPKPRGYLSDDGRRLVDWRVENRLDNLPVMA